MYWWIVTVIVCPGQVSAQTARQARQFQEKMSECSVRCSASQGPVCGTDGKTYRSECDLRQAGCAMVRRQGRSFESKMLKIEVDYYGSCRDPCPGMQSLGQFQAFGARATNYGEWTWHHLHWIHPQQPALALIVSTLSTTESEQIIIYMNTNKINCDCFLIYRSVYPWFLPLCDNVTERRHETQPSPGLLPDQIWQVLQSLKN